MAVPLAGEVKAVDVMLATPPGVRPTMRTRAFAAHCRELLPELSSYDKSLTPVGHRDRAAAGLVGDESSAAETDRCSSWPMSRINSRAVRPITETPPKIATASMLLRPAESQ